MAEVDPTRYPKAKYHHSDGPILVASPEEEATLSSGWVDHPSLVASPKGDDAWDGTRVPKRRGRPPRGKLEENGITA